MEIRNKREWEDKILLEKGGRVENKLMILMGSGLRREGKANKRR
mgnify:CR=1 FL=1